MTHRTDITRPVTWTCLTALLCLVSWSARGCYEEPVPAPCGADVCCELGLSVSEATKVVEGREVVSLEMGERVDVCFRAEGHIDD